MLSPERSPPAPIEHLKSIIGTRFFHHSLCKFQIFFLRPEIHFFQNLRPHRPYPPYRIIREIVKIYGMVEYRRKLCMNRPQVICRIGLPIFILVCHQAICHFATRSHLLLQSLQSYGFQSTARSLCV